MKAQWLYSKHPITIDSDVATIIGLNESIVLQQLNYWLHSKAAKKINRKLWVYNTYENWQKDNFPFWSISTIKRIFTKLENEGLIITDNFNRAGFDKTKWYSININKLDMYMNRASCQSDTTRVSSCTDGACQIEPTYTRDYTETTTDIEEDRPTKFKQFLNQFYEAFRIPNLPDKTLTDLVHVMADLSDKQFNHVVNAVLKRSDPFKNQIQDPVAYFYKCIRNEMKNND